MRTHETPDDVHLRDEHNHVHSRREPHAADKQRRTTNHDGPDHCNVPGPNNPHAETPDYGHAHDAGRCTLVPAAQDVLASPTRVGHDLRTTIRIMQMDCPTEIALIRRKLNTLDTVRSMEFNLMHRILTIVHTPAAPEEILFDAIRSLGFTPELPEANADLSGTHGTQRTAWWPLARAGAMAVASGRRLDSLPVWLSAVLAAAVLSCGLTTYRKGWVAMRNGAWPVA